MGLKKVDSLAVTQSQKKRVRLHLGRRGGSRQFQISDVGKFGQDILKIPAGLSRARCENNPRPRMPKEDAQKLPAGIAGCADHTDLYFFIAWNTAQLCVLF